MSILSKHLVLYYSIQYILLPSKYRISQLDEYHMHGGVYIYDKIQKHFQNVMLVGMASEISKNYTYKCVDRSRHNEIKGAKAKCAH